MKWCGIDVLGLLNSHLIVKLFLIQTSDIHVLSSKCIETLVQIGLAFRKTLVSTTVKALFVNGAAQTSIQIYLWDLHALAPEISVES